MSPGRLFFFSAVSRIVAASSFAVRVIVYTADLSKVNFADSPVFRLLTTDAAVSDAPPPDGEETCGAAVTVM